MPVKTQLKGRMLKVELPLQRPKISTSGKNFIIATTRGPIHTGIEYKKQEIRVVANAFIKNTEHVTPRKHEDSRSLPKTGKNKS